MVEIRKEIKTLKKKIVSLLIIAFMIAMIFPLALIFPGVQVGLAQNTGQINTTVSAVLVSIEVLNGVVAYGTVGLGAKRDTTAVGSNVNNPQLVNNIGTVQVDTSIKTSNAVGAVTWLVGTNMGVNTFNHFASIEAAPNWTIGMVANEVYYTLRVDLPTANFENFDLQIGLPTSTSDYASHNVTITVLAVQG